MKPVFHYVAAIGLFLFLASFCWLLFDHVWCYYRYVNLCLMWIDTWNGFDSLSVYSSATNGSVAFCFHAAKQTCDNPHEWICENSRYLSTYGISVYVLVTLAWGGGLISSAACILFFSLHSLFCFSLISTQLCQKCLPSIISSIGHSIVVRTDGILILNFCLLVGKQNASIRYLHVCRIEFSACLCLSFACFVLGFFIFILNVLPSIVPFSSTKQFVKTACLFKNIRILPLVLITAFQTRVDIRILKTESLCNSIQVPVVL